MMTHNSISRRNLLKGAGAAATIGALGSRTTETAIAQTNLGGARLRTLALIGDRYHNPDYIRVSLNRLFKELDLPIDYTMNYYDLSANLMKPYQLFICFRDNMIWPGGYSGRDASSFYEGRLENQPDVPHSKADFWITEEQGAAVKDFVAAGKGFYSMHNNAFVSRSSKNYREVQGGVALSHPPLRPFQVRIVNKNHPVTEDVEDFMVDDEQHYLRYDKDPKGVLIESVNLDGLTFTARDPDDPQAQPKNLGTTTVSGWAHKYGSGRVVFTAVGHIISAMWQPQYLRMQKNSVRWLPKNVLTSNRILGLDLLDDFEMRCIVMSRISRR
jgi:type 1 glutamine amidotransferase